MKTGIRYLYSKIKEAKQRVKDEQYTLTQCLKGVNDPYSAKQFKMLEEQAKRALGDLVYWQWRAACLRQEINDLRRENKQIT
jgi:hypothetical protein